MFYRPGSSDVYNIRRLLFCDKGDEEYFTPKELTPSVILDIGANTGIFTIFMANTYPGAQIMSFEPVPDNFEILKKNVEKFPNVKAFPIALGKADGTIVLQSPEKKSDFVGYSQHGMGGDHGGSINAPVRSLTSLLDELKCDHVDMIKIDAEGDEYDILTNLRPQMLSEIQWIVGELHGNKDLELLKFLSAHFYLEINKKIWGRLIKFKACKKSLVEKVFKESGRKAIMRMHPF